MARLIDADALWYRTFSCEDAADVRKEIEIAPTVDAVELVRCKDCKHYNTASCSDGCGWCEEMNAGWSDNDFCSYGERREDG